MRSFSAKVGSLLRKRGKKRKPKATDPFDVFLEPAAARLNRARLEHLRSLQLDIGRKRVLEVGAGIGLLTGFFEELGCSVLSTDGREENVAEMNRRFRHRAVRQLDLDNETTVAAAGQFDIIFCYGTLYHLSNPEQALNALATIGAEMILLETCVTPGRHYDVHLVRESASGNQAISRVGCRPTRPWIMAKLATAWGHSYVSKTQPDHPDFEIDWEIPYKHGNYRAVFVGSKVPLRNENLMDVLPDHQVRCRS
jgi:SAM-dependent methyltransferase